MHRDRDRDSEVKSIVKLESHISLSKIQEQIYLLLINKAAAVDVGFTEASGAFPAAEPGTAVADGLLQLLLADPAVSVRVEFHQPALELLHRHLVLAAARHAPSGVAACYRHRKILLRERT